MALPKLSDDRLFINSVNASVFEKSALSRRPSLLTVVACVLVAAVCVFMAYTTALPRMSETARYLVNDISEATKSASRELKVIPAKVGPYLGYPLDEQSEPITITLKDNLIPKSASKVWLLYGKTYQNPLVRFSRNEKLLSEFIPGPDINFGNLPVYEIISLGEIPEHSQDRDVSIEFSAKPGWTKYSAVPLAVIVTPAGVEIRELFTKFSAATNHTAYPAAAAWSILALAILVSLIPGKTAKVALGILALLALSAALYAATQSNRGLQRYWEVGMSKEQRELVPVNPPAFYFWFQPLLNQFEVPPRPVLFPGARSEGSFPVQVYGKDSSEPISKPWGEILGGYYSTIQESPAATLVPLAYAWLACFGLYLMSVAIFRTHFLLFLPLAAAGVASIVLSIYFGAGWDELFINLRHSYMVAHHNIFSYNAKEIGEGTVDFLPFFVVGLLGKLGAPLVDSILCVNFLGNLGILLLAYCTVKRYTENRIYAVLVGSAMAVFPCVLYVSGTGFTAPFFSAWALWAMYFLFVSEDRRPLGFFLLGSLTLVRTEGVFLAGLCLAYEVGVRNFSMLLDPARWAAWFYKTLRLAILLIGPFAASCLVRKYYFGAALPNPITFKSTGGDIEFLKVGIEQLRLGIMSYHLDWLALAFACGALLSPRPLLRRFGILSQMAILMVYVLPYYSGGGDWFRVEWARYLMPLAVLSYLLTACVLYSAAFSRAKELGGLLLASVLVLCFIQWRDNVRDNSGFTGSYTDFAWNRGKWDRVRRLASLGEFYKRSTPPDTKIASGEMSTIMYFADREIVDLLGTVNPDIAHQPVSPMERGGDLIHRKRNPGTILTRHADIIAFYEPVIGVATDFEHLDLDAMSKRFREVAYTDEYSRIAWFRAGSFDHLLQHGYTPIAVAFKDRLFHYWVSSRILDAHLASLKAEGIVPLGTLNMPYKIRDDVVERFEG